MLFVANGAQIWQISPNNYGLNFVGEIGWQIFTKAHKGW